MAQPPNGDSEPRPVVRADPSRPLWLTPSVVETVPLREPGIEVAARRLARRSAGFEEDGLDYPRAQLWLLAVLPASVIALLCLAALVITGAAVWGVAAVGAAAVAGATAGYLVRDPLRMSSAERRELVADRSWQSHQAWTGVLADTPERRLVAQAQDAVIRLVRAPAWSSPGFEEHRLRVDLKAELDEIDRQAHDLAVGRPPAAAGRDDVGAGERTALRGRVDALSAYADAVSAVGPAHDRYQRPVDEGDGDAHRALTATVRDEFATDRWTQLSQELPGTDHNPDGSTDVHQTPETLRPPEILRPPETLRPPEILRPPEAHRPSEP